MAAGSRIPRAARAARAKRSGGGSGSGGAEKMVGVGGQSFPVGQRGCRSTWCQVGALRPVLTRGERYARTQRGTGQTLGLHLLW